MEQNKFLMDFMRMRKSLNAAPAPVTPTPAKSSNIIQTTTKSKVVEAPVAPVMEDDVTYKKIIENTPPKADVIEYLRKRVEELKPLHDF